MGFAQSQGQMQRGCLSSISLRIRWLVLSSRHETANFANFASTAQHRRPDRRRAREIALASTLLSLFRYGHYQLSLGQ